MTNIKLNLTFEAKFVGCYRMNRNFYCKIQSNLQCDLFQIYCAMFRTILGRYDKNSVQSEAKALIWIKISYLKPFLSYMKPT